MTNAAPTMSAPSSQVTGTAGLALQLRKADIRARLDAPTHPVRDLTEYVRQAEALTLAGILVIVPEDQQ